MSDLASEAREVGRQWATYEAATAELIRLAAYMTSAKGQFPKPFIRSKSSECRGAELFVLAIRPECNGDRSKVHVFWNACDPPPDDEYIQAFAEGAIEVYEESPRTSG